MALHLRKIVQTVILVALVAIPRSVNAFAPSKSTVIKTSCLYSTKEKEEDQTQQKEENPKGPPGMRIKIAPLGSSQQFGGGGGASGHLKEFPTYEMKERFRKIRSPRKKPPKVVMPRKKDPSPQVVPPPAPCPPLLFGIGEFFDTDQLIQTVKENADVGKPLESSRTLADKIPVASTSTSTTTSAGTNATVLLSCGSASCTQGGWPSKTPKANTTQIFYLLHGFGCLTDMDGTRHYFGPGDTVVVPRNWAGRCDVAEDLHKIWFTLDHETTTTTTSSLKETKEDTDDTAEESNSLKMVRAKVIHYHELVKWSFRHSTNDDESLNDDPHKSETSFYNLDELGMALSCVTCFSPSASVPFVVPPRKYVDCFHILEGTMVLTPWGSKENEPTFQFTSGDTVVLPKGWTGYCEIKDPVKALRVKA